VNNSEIIGMGQMDVNTAQDACLTSYAVPLHRTDAGRPFCPEQFSEIAAIVDMFR
jgi:hypothetical protein